MLLLAEQAARAAGDHAASHRHLATSQLKAEQQIVTQLDHECQAIIVENIKNQFPQHGFLAEENRDAALLKTPPTDSDQIWWVIDPIDGTRNFAHGGSHYAVSIAALQNGVPVLGVIYEPATGKMFSAINGRPACCDSQPIRCGDEHLHRNSIVAIPGHSPDGVHPAIITFMEKYACVALGSATLHYTGVATGVYAGTCSWQVRLWDIAAGAIICQSAGAIVTDINGRNLFPIDCLAYEGRAVPIIVAGPKAHQQMLEIISAPSDR